MFQTIQLESDGQSCSVAKSCPIFCKPTDCSTPGSSVLHYLLLWDMFSGNLCFGVFFPGVCSNSCPLTWWWSLTISSSATPFPFAFNLSQHHQYLFQWVGSLHQVAKVLELQLQSFQWIFKVDFLWNWFDFLAVQGDSWVFSAPQFKTTYSLAFSLLYGPTLMTTGKTIALTIWTFVGKVMSLLFNMVLKFVIIFLPRSKCLLISWLQSLSRVILEPPR